MIGLSIPVCGTLILRNCTSERALQILSEYEIISTSCLIEILTMTPFNYSLFSCLFPKVDTNGITQLLEVAVQQQLYSVAEEIIVSGGDFFESNWWGLIINGNSEETFNLLNVALHNVVLGREESTQSGILQMVNKCCKHDSSIACQLVKLLLKQSSFDINITSDFLDCCIRSSICDDNLNLLQLIMPHVESAIITGHMFELAVHSSSLFLVVLLKDFLPKDYVRECTSEEIKNSDTYKNTSEIKEIFSSSDSLDLATKFAKTRYLNTVVMCFPDLLEENLYDPSCVHLADMLVGKTVSGSIALRKAITSNNKTLIKKIISMDVLCDITVDMLISYCKNNSKDKDTKLLQLLLQHRKSDLRFTINERSIDGNTPLGIAVVASNVSLAEVLLENGADPEIGFIRKGTEVPLLFSAVSNESNPRMLELLLRYGASPNNKLQTDANPLYENSNQSAASISFLSLAMNKSITILELLVSHGACLTRILADGSSILHHVKYVEQIKLLSGAPLDLVHNYETPSTLALSRGLFDVTLELLMLGADTDPSGVSLSLLSRTLRWIISSPKTESLTLLVDELIRRQVVATHADIMFLLTAIVNEDYINFELFDDLINIKHLTGDLNALDPDSGDSVLTAAVCCKLPSDERKTGSLKRLAKCIKILLTYADPNICNQQHNSPLLLSIPRSTHLAEELLHSPTINVNLSLPNGWSPLHAAIEAFNVDVCSLLLMRGADPNPVYSCEGTADQHTPLTYIVFECPTSTTALKLLLESGANPNLKIYRNMYAADIMNEQISPSAAHVEVYKILKQYGGLRTKLFKLKIKKYF